MATRAMEDDEFRDTEISQIPETWLVMSIKELAVVRYGKARPGKKGAVPAVGSGGVYAWVDKPLVEFPTIVIGRKGTAGKAWLYKEPCWPSDTTFYLDWTREVDIDFLYGYLRLNPLSGEHARTTLPSLQKPDLEAYKLPFPPLTEQRRIANVLSTIQQAIDAQERVINAARELKRSLMHRLFTFGPYPEECVTKESEVGEIPEHWRVQKTSEVITFSKKPRDLSINDYEQVPFLPMEVIPEEGLFVDVFELRTPTEITSGTYFQKGDILIAKITPSFENGKQGIAGDIPEPFGYATTEVYAIHPTDPTKLDREFLFYFFELPHIRSAIAARMEGTTGRQRVPKSVIENYPFPLPPLHEQKQIAGSLIAVQEKMEGEKRRKTALQLLSRSMLHHLMTGQIRVNNLEVEL